MASRPSTSRPRRQAESSNPRRESDNDGLSRGFLIDEGPTGRIFVYDAATGNKLGHVAFSVGGKDRLAAVHPRGDKAYVASEGPRNDQMTITVVSLTTFTVLKELFVPSGDFFLSQAVR